MGNDGNSLGSDDISTGKALHLTIFIFILLGFLFFLTNATQAARDLAAVYLYFGLLGVAWITADMALRIRGSKTDLPDTVTFEKESPVYGDLGGNVLKALMVGGSLAFGGFIFLAATSSSAVQLVSAPTFQLIEPGAGTSAFNSGAAGIVENIIFFCGLLPTLYVILKRVSRHKLIALPLAVILAAAVFTSYHFAVYGESPQSLDSVFYFGLVCGGSTALTGNAAFCHSIHFFNNAGITFARLASADMLLWVLFYEILVIGGTLMYIRREWGR